MIQFLQDNWSLIFTAVSASIATLVVPPLWSFLIGRSSERYKLRLARTQKAEKICELFAYMPRMIDNRLELGDELKIHQLILEMSFYLPSDLVCELSETICKPEKLVTYKELFIKIRKYVLFPTILGYQSRCDGLKPENITHIGITSVPILHAQPARQSPPAIQERMTPHNQELPRAELQ